MEKTPFYICNDELCFFGIPETKGHKQRIEFLILIENIIQRSGVLSLSNIIETTVTVTQIEVDSDDNITVSFDVQAHFNSIENFSLSCGETKKTIIEKNKKVREDDIKNLKASIQSIRECS